LKSNLFTGRIYIENQIYSDLTNRLFFSFKSPLPVQILKKERSDGFGCD